MLGLLNLPSHTETLRNASRPASQRGRKPRNWTELIGSRFGLLSVVDVLPPSDERGEAKAIAVCDCGGAATVRPRDLVKGHTTSCGCVKRQNYLTFWHGKAEDVGLAKRRQIFKAIVKYRNDHAVAAKFGIPVPLVGAVLRHHLAFLKTLPALPGATRAERSVMRKAKRVDSDPIELTFESGDDFDRFGDLLAEENRSVDMDKDEFAATISFCRNQLLDSYPVTKVNPSTRSSRLRC